MYKQFKLVIQLNACKCSLKLITIKFQFDVRKKKIQFLMPKSRIFCYQFTQSAHLNSCKC